jgi:hypothetical protein
MKPINRLGLKSGLVYLSLPTIAKAASTRLIRPMNDIMASPLRPVVGSFTQTDFNGDDMTRSHNALWNLAAYIENKGGRPAVSETREVVIVGGGIAGLSSAYFLQGKKPLLLEVDPQFGGNSRGEILGDTAFSIGAAYITKPEPGGSVHRMLHATGVLRLGRLENESESRVHVKGRGFLSLWKGEADPAQAEFIQRIAHDFAEICQNNYPSIPFEPGGMSRPELEQLDRVTLAQWLLQRYGNQIPVHLLEYLQLYCWSSFGASADEVSAAQALNFLTAETEGIVAFPGGNSVIATGLYNLLLKNLGRDSLRGRNMVLEIRTNSQGLVDILLETPEGVLKTIQTKACIVAAPKYVAQYLVPEMTPLQKQVAKAITYRGYVVANVLLNAKVPSPTFDAYALEGVVPPSPSFARPGNRAYSDVSFAQWAAGDRGRQSILTIYKPFPYDGARNHMTSPIGFTRSHNQVREKINEVLASMGLGPQAIAGIRLTRWGHAIPTGQPGFIASRSDLVFKQPTNGRIFYANQDNDANPAFECAFSNAEIAAAGVLKYLNAEGRRTR